MDLIRSRIIQEGFERMERAWKYYCNNNKNRYGLFFSDNCSVDKIFKPPEAIKDGDFWWTLRSAVNLPSGECQRGQ